MLNPSLDKFVIEFGTKFYDKQLMEKYEKYLFHKNSPIKDMQTYMHESIKSISIPGLTLQTVAINAMSNLGPAGNLRGQAPVTTNRITKGNAPLNEIFENVTVTVNFRNTIINWMYIYELFRTFYARNTRLAEFSINIIMRDSADVDMLMFNFEDCFISSLPGLEFSFAQSFRETKDFDVTFTFNRLNVKFMIPEFQLLEKTFGGGA